MRSLRLLTALTAFLLCTSASAQLSLKLPSLKSESPASTSFKNDIQKVVEDYPHQYAQLRGEVINKNPQTVEYASRVQPAGTQDAMVVEYSAFAKKIYTWQTTVLTTEDFEEATKKYKWLYQQLKGMNIKYVADMYTLRGDYAEPEESIGFASCVLTPFNPPTPLAKLKIEVLMNFEFPEWKVSLQIYDKEREDDEQGEVADGK